MTTPSDKAIKKRDELANEQGDRHANPIIRSMYPSRSRGQMAREFGQLFSIGWDAGYAVAKEETSQQGAYTQACQYLNDQIRISAGQKLVLLEDVGLLIEALRFYSIEDNYEWFINESHPSRPKVTPVLRDNGMLARIAIKTFTSKYPDYFAVKTAKGLK